MHNWHKGTLIILDGAIQVKYKDMIGIPPKLCQHRIYLDDNTKPICQRPYYLNPKYSLKVKQEIDKLLDVGFI